MIDPSVLGVAALTAGLYAVIVLLFGGLLRIPWRYAAQIALGVAVVVGAGSIASTDVGRTVDTGFLVLLAAAGGGIAARAYERGKARRDAMIAAIVGTR
jgi:hypothetical protein